MSAKTKALLGSFARVFAAAALAAFLELGKQPLDLRLDDAKSLVNAGIAALILTLINYLRPGETRFGRGSEDIGMGGEDTLGPGGEIQVPEVVPEVHDHEVGAEPEVPPASRAARVRRARG